MVARLLAARIAALSMDEPPAVETVLAARAIADDLPEDPSEACRELVDAMRRALCAAADREVLFVYAVPAVAAALELLTTESRHTPTALAGAQYDLETLPRIEPKRDSPDVPLSSLRRRSVADGEGDL